MIAMRDKLIDLITVGIVRYSVQQAAGNNPDMADIIADVLIENDYCKASDTAEEIFTEISKASADWGCYCISAFKWGYVTSDVSRTLAELNKKYIGRDTNVTTNTGEGK